MRTDEDFLWGLMRNPDMQRKMGSNALTCREHSTLFGLLRRWPQCERRLRSGNWDGVERRASRISGPHHW